ncbi:MAG: hypothetical protein K2X25_11155 [Caulobacteraceae bacterium]|nr:hypothetical protein [Caulobacteraceae bacterium]
MTDFFDTGDDDERVLVALQGIVREAGLDPYLDIRVPDAGSRVGGTILLLNRAERVLEELRELDESVTDAGEWSEVVFKADPDLPKDYREAASAPERLFDEAGWRGPTVIGRQRETERRNAVSRALLSIGSLRRAIRNQG